MKIAQLLPWLLCVVLAGCGSSGLLPIPLKMEIEIVNRSSRSLENALARFGGNDCKWGYVEKSASYMFYPHPITAQTEIHWDERGKHRVEKLDLSKVYISGKSGRITFTVYDDKAEVNFREKS